MSGGRGEEGLQRGRGRGRDGIPHLATGLCQDSWSHLGSGALQIKGAGDVRLGLGDRTRAEGKSELNVEVQGATEDLSPNS